MTGSFSKNPTQSNRVSALPLADTGRIAWLRQRRPLGPLGTLVLGVGCGLAAVFGLVVALTLEPSCTPADFERFHLACERV